MAGALALSVYCGGVLPRVLRSVSSSGYGVVNSGKRDLEDYNHLTILSSKHLENSPSHKGMAGAGRPPSLLVVATSRAKLL